MSDDDGDEDGRGRVWSWNSLSFDSGWPLICSLKPAWPFLMFPLMLFGFISPFTRGCQLGSGSMLNEWWYGNMERTRIGTRFLVCKFSLLENVVVVDHNNHSSARPDDMWNRWLWWWWSVGLSSLRVASIITIITTTTPLNTMITSLLVVVVMMINNAACMHVFRLKPPRKLKFPTQPTHSENDNWILANNEHCCSTCSRFVNRKKLISWKVETLDSWFCILEF